MAIYGAEQRTKKLKAGHGKNSENHESGD